MNNLRPDELALQSDIERSKSSDKIVGKGIKTVSGLALGAGGLGLSSKILPFINEFIPAELAMKGISKVSPKLGSFLKKGMDQGLQLKDGLKFIKDNLNGQNQSQNTPNPQNIVSQYDDKLHAFIENEIKNGRTPLEAGAIARTNKDFEKSIKNIEKDHKTNWSSILESTYGSAQQPQQGQPMQQQTQTQQQGSPKQPNALQARLNANYRSPQQQNALSQQKQNPTGDEALLAKFDQILKM